MPPKLQGSSSVRTLQVFAAIVALCLVLVPRPAIADDTGMGVFRHMEIRDIFSQCDGECGTLVNAGGFLMTPMEHVFGIGQFRPPWEYSFEDSAFVSASVSRPWLVFGKYAQIEPEVGFGQRFGAATSSEVWAALVFRWLYFPWDEYLDTSVTVTTGVNYAFSHDVLEAMRDPLNPPRKLLHYFSPEISFAIPGHEPTEFVIRLHHRSGGGEDYLVGPLFGNVNGGAQYLTAGFRFKN